MKNLFIISLFLIGCQTDELIKYEIVCDFYVDNLCVKTNGHTPIDPKIISWTLGRVEYWTNRFITSSTLDLPALIEEYQLKVEYVDEIPVEDSEDIRGMYFKEFVNQDNIYFNEVILLKFLETDEEFRQCVETYYVLSHEVLHFIDYDYLGASAGSGHNTPGLYKPTDPNDNSKVNDFAEIHDYSNIYYFCAGEEICNSDGTNCQTMENL